MQNHFQLIYPEKISPSETKFQDRSILVKISTTKSTKKTEFIVNNLLDCGAIRATWFLSYLFFV